MAPPLATIRNALADGLVEGGHRKRAGATLDLALEFHTWHSLVRRSGLSQRQAVEAMLTALSALRRGARQAPARTPQRTTT